MLKFQCLKNHAGLCVLGPIATLRALHLVVHDVNERSPLIQDREGFFLALAYDARKAIENKENRFESEDQGLFYGFKILWPVLLLQTRMLRASLAFFDSTKEQQAVAFALEAVVEVGLHADFQGQEAALQAAYEHIDPAHPFAENKIHSRGAQYSMWNAKQRREGLQNILLSLDPNYPAIYAMRFQAGERGMLAPLALDSLESAEWVDPKW